MGIADSSYTVLGGSGGNHTPAGTPDLVLVTWSGLTGESQPSSATYGGEAMTAIGSVQSVGDWSVYRWYKVAPLTGTRAVAFGGTPWGDARVIARTWSGVHQSNPLRDEVLADWGGSGDEIGEATPDSEVGDVIVMDYCGDNKTYTEGAGVTFDMNNDLAGVRKAVGGTKAGAAGSTTIGLTWTGAAGWSMRAVAVVPAEGGSGPPIAALVQQHS